MLKGPKFGEPLTFDLDEAKSTIKDKLAEFIKEISETKKIPIASFIPWQNKIMELVENKTETFITASEKHSIFKDWHVSLELEKLQKDFVFCPIDNAANNIAIANAYMLPIF